MAAVVTVPKRIRLPQAQREVHLVAADEQANVRQADLEEDVGTDQGAVKEVAVVGQEPDLFDVGTLMRDLAVESEEKRQPVRVAGGHHEGNHSFGREPALRAAAWRGTRSAGSASSSIIQIQSAPLATAFRMASEKPPAPPRSPRTGRNPRWRRPATSLEGTVPLSTRQMSGPKRSGC